jgi:hypothetical protein
LDYLQFFAEVIKALAWPAATVFIVLMLKRPLGRLIRKLQSLKWKDLELDWRKGVIEAEAEAEKAELNPVSMLIQSILEGPSLDLAKIAPRQAVLEAWREVELSAVDVAKRHGIQLSERHQKSPREVIRALQKANLLDSETASLFFMLFNLRNQAAHNTNLVLEPEGATEYTLLAKRLTASLKTV